MKSQIRENMIANEKIVHNGFIEAKKLFEISQTMDIKIQKLADMFQLKEMARHKIREQKGKVKVKLYTMDELQKIQKLIKKDVKNEKNINQELVKKIQKKYKIGDMEIRIFFNISYQQLAKIKKNETYQIKNETGKKLLNKEIQENYRFKSYIYSEDIQKIKQQYCYNSKQIAKIFREPIEKRDVSEFYGKLMDCPGVQGIMVAQNGYRPTAEQYANHYNIKTITTKELPNICQITAMDIKRVLLPDKETVGKPFWCIMETDKDSEMTTGNYFILPDKNKKIIPLFLSKKAAEEVRKHILDKEEYQVYGIRKENLAFLCDIYKLTSEVKLGICPLLSSMIQKGADFFLIEIEGKELRQEFLE